MMHLTNFGQKVTHLVYVLRLKNDASSKFWLKILASYKLRLKNDASCKFFVKIYKMRHFSIKIYKMRHFLIEIYKMRHFSKNVYNNLRHFSIKFYKMRQFSIKVYKMRLNAYCTHIYVLKKMGWRLQVKAGTATFTDSWRFEKYNYIVYKEVETLPGMLFLSTLKMWPAAQAKDGSAVFIDRLWYQSKSAWFTGKS